MLSMSTWAFVAAVVTSIDTLWVPVVQCYQGRWGAEVHLDAFRQAYAVEKTHLEARRQGHTVQERSLADGSVKLTIQLGDAS